MYQTTGEVYPALWPVYRADGGRNTANWSVTSSVRLRKRNTAAGRPPARPGTRWSPVVSSRRRRTSTRWRFVADTSWPRAAR